MPGLRWILLGLGALFCLGLWWWESHRRRQAADDDMHADFVPPRHARISTGRLEPTIGAEPQEGSESAVGDVPAGRWNETPPPWENENESADADAVADAVADDGDEWQSEQGPEHGPSQGPEQDDGNGEDEAARIVSMRLFSAPDEPFDGRALLNALRMQGLQHGKFSIFHKYDARGGRQFSVASLLEPGSFDLGRMEQMTFKGVILFAVQRDAGEAGLAEMRRTAQALAGQLRGTLTAER